MGQSRHKWQTPTHLLVRFAQKATVRSPRDGLLPPRPPIVLQYLSSNAAIVAAAVPSSAVHPLIVRNHHVRSLRSKGDLMTARATRLVAFLVLLIVVACGVSLASLGPAVAADGMRSPSTFCLTEHVLFSRGTRHSNYSHIRMAQIHCRCCGRDENGHCNHQCCD